MMREIANPAHRLIPRGFERLRCDRGDYGHDFRLAQYGVAIAPEQDGIAGRDIPDCARELYAS